MRGEVDEGGLWWCARCESTKDAVGRHDSSRAKKCERNRGTCAMRHESREERAAHTRAHAPSQVKGRRGLSRYVIQDVGLTKGFFTIM